MSYMSHPPTPNLPILSYLHGVVKELLERDLHEVDLHEIATGTQMSKEKLYNNKKYKQTGISNRLYKLRYCNHVKEKIADLNS